MTEDQAKEKWCPMARVHSGTQNYVAAVNRNLLPRDVGKDKCCASDCMMWRAKTEFPGDQDYEAVDGYCGLAGKMIISEHEQGSELWHKDRAGIPTASEFGKIITPGGVASKSADTYMNTLLAEWYLNKPVDNDFQSDWMKRGNDIEDEARITYVFRTDRVSVPVGFCFRDEQKLVGCSPDGLVGEDGLNEFKCPKANTMISYILSNKLPDKYKPQVQGQLWVTGRDWCDFMAYHPDMRSVLIRVNRDDQYIRKMHLLVNEFIELMLEKREELKTMLAAA